MSAVRSPLESAREAFGRRSWQEAFEQFSLADAADRLAADDLSALGEAAYWSGRPDDYLDARERAYARYVEAEQRPLAAHQALLLAHEYNVELNLAAAGGWLAAAERLLDAEDDCAEHAHLACFLAFVAVRFGDAPGGLEQATRAYDIATRFGDRSLQASALHLQGQALIAQDRLAEGMALVDEAMAAAVSGELHPYAAANLYCWTMGICQWVGDYRRAGEWNRVAERCYERHGITQFSGECHVHRAGVLRVLGAWSKAEADARRGCDEVRVFHNLAHVGLGQYEIGEISLRRGDLDGAEIAFREAHEHGFPPQPGLALLRLAQGNFDAAATSIAEARDQAVESLARARLLPAQVEIALAVGDIETARTAVAELVEHARGLDCPAVGGAAACARGALALAEDDSRQALGALREGLSLWQQAEAPYETARARVLLAEAYRARGDAADAIFELEAARAAFERLGAAPDAQRVAELLGTAPTIATSSRSPVAKTLMFTDIVRSTELTEAIGDDAWNDLLHWHDDTLRALFRDHGGEEISHTGDGFFVAFDTTPTAVECAVAIQRTLADNRRSHGFAPQVRIGLHRDEATRRQRNYFGKAVHRAARIAERARGGEILASEATVLGATIAVSQAREVKLRGIAKPVAVVTVDWT